MNILYICDEYPPCQHGGIGTVTQILSRYLVDKGHKIVVAGFYPYYRKALPNEIDNGVIVHRIFYGNTWKLKLSKHWLSGRFINIKKEFDKYIKFLNWLIDKYELEIIEMPDFSEAIYYGRFEDINFSALKKPIVVKLHGSYSFVKNNLARNMLIYNLERKNILNASGVIAISEFVKKKTISIFGIINKIDIIYHGIKIGFEVENFISKKNNKVIFAGSVSENKGIFQLLKAWKYVNYQIFNFELHIYGKGSISEIKKLNYILKKENINNVFYNGFINFENLSEEYKNASLAIFPSYIEAFGMAPIEAMSFGCPTIFTKRASGPEIIENKVDGLLVNPDDIQEIADSILYLLIYREHALTMAKNGLKKIAKLFDISIISDKHIKFYKTIICNKTTT